MAGVVHIVGAGPGAADLLTLRAARLIETADVLLHDALVPAEIIALATKARKLNVGKRGGRASTDQAFINRLLVRLAARHGTIVRLKGGDPMLFGRAQEEIDACRAAGVRVEVTPGVSAGFAAAADILSSLSQREISRSVVFVTPATARGATPDDTWADAAAAADTAVIYMGKAQAARVHAALRARGIPASRPAVLVESASLQSTVIGGDVGDLEAMVQRAGDGPALLMISEALARVAAEHRARPETVDALERSTG